MTLEKSHKKYCKVAVSLNDKGVEKDRPDMFILDADGMAGDEKEYQKITESGICISGYSPIFGSMMTGTSFNCAAAALMLKNQMHYACPVQDNPYKLNLCRKTEPAQIQGISCIRYNCVGEKAVIKLTA